ncbi:MAG: hypothetical protein E6Q88_07215 [Lysobacteraceae bacterium]|nr:MAG: hypothetical protein E6Q88_07215 [Xanthomonadaceae bacterium]
MDVVAHHGVGVDGNCETLGQGLNAIFDPVLAMFERSTSVVIQTTKKGAAHAALHAVEHAAGAGRNQMRAGLGHVSMLTGAGFWAQSGIS